MKTLERLSELRRKNNKGLSGSLYLAMMERNRDQVRKEYEEGRRDRTVPEDTKPKKVYDELVFGEVGGHPLLVLKCKRDGCWLNGVAVKEWRTGNLDYAEVSAAVLQHQFQHVGDAFGKLFKGLQR